MNSRSFICKCGNPDKGWVTEDLKTPPCPKCGRVYIGKYNIKTLIIEAIEV